MPTYQYACTECGHGFEAVQSFTDDALTECQQCNGRLRKVFSSVGIVFKGSGFYRNDSREAARNASSAGDRIDKGDKVGAEKGPEKSKAGSPASDSTPKSSEKTEKTEKAPKSSEKARTPRAAGPAGPSSSRPPASGRSSTEGSAA